MSTNFLARLGTYVSVSNRVPAQKPEITGRIGDRKILLSAGTCCVAVGGAVVCPGVDAGVF